MHVPVFVLPKRLRETAAATPHGLGLQDFPFSCRPPAAEHF